MSLIAISIASIRVDIQISITARRLTLISDRKRQESDDYIKFTVKKYTSLRLSDILLFQVTRDH